MSAGGRTVHVARDGRPGHDVIPAPARVARSAGHGDGRLPRRTTGSGRWPAGRCCRAGTRLPDDVDGADGEVIAGGLRQGRAPSASGWPGDWGHARGKAPAWRSAHHRPRRFPPRSAMEIRRVTDEVRLDGFAVQPHAVFVRGEPIQHHLPGRDRGRRRQGARWRRAGSTSRMRHGELEACPSCAARAARAEADKEAHGQDSSTESRP
jgi:hypothetical protein